MWDKHEEIPIVTLAVRIKELSELLLIIEAHRKAKRTEHMVKAVKYVGVSKKRDS